MLYTGLDVSKDTINYAIPRGNGGFDNGRINNSLRGFKALENTLLKRATDDKVVIACETTGLYSFPVMDYFSTRGWHCNEIHAWQIASHKRTILQKNKTDKADAKDISDYCTRYAERLSVPYVSRTAELVELGFLMRILRQMKKRNRAWNNIYEAYNFINEDRVEGLKMEFANKGVQYIMEHNTKEMKNYQKGVVGFCKQYFGQQWECLESIKGIGENTIPMLLYYTNNFTRFRDGRDFASYCGVVPNFYESGTSIQFKTKIAHKSVCNRELRTAMVQAGGIAMRYNKQCKNLVERLGHLHWSQRVVACAKKLAIQAYYCGSMLQMYDPNA
jgi:transposase